MRDLRLRKMGYGFLYVALFFCGLTIVLGRIGDWSFAVYAVSIWGPYIVLKFLISLCGACIIFLPSLSNFVTQKNLVILIGVSIGWDLILIFRGLLLSGSLNIALISFLVHLYFLYLLFKDRLKNNDTSA